MATDKIKGGRPPLGEGKRTFKINVRFTDSERDSILDLQKTLGLSKTQLVRMRMLGNNAGLIINARQMITALDKVGAELARSGNNINQLARHANQLNKKGAIPPAIIEHFLRLFEQHLAIRMDLDITIRSVIRALKH